MVPLKELNTHCQLFVERSDAAVDQINIFPNSTLLFAADFVETVSGSFVKRRAKFKRMVSKEEHLEVASTTAQNPRKDDQLKDPHTFVLHHNPKRIASFLDRNIVNLATKHDY